MDKLSSVKEIITRGSEVLAQRPNFKLVGREAELKEITNILMKMRKRNLLITGRGGVGISSMVLGIQASKSDLTTPVDIVGKRLYWLQTDKLFESGNSQVINQLFDKMRQVLANTKDSILVLEDTVDFLRSAQGTGSSHLLNGLMGDIKSGKYQLILEAKDECLGEVLKCDGDIHESCTLYELKEPSLEKLKEIVTEVSKTLHSHHGIQISDVAINCAVTLTEKYKLQELRAQPDAAISLLDKALTDYRRIAHLNSKQIEDLEKALSVQPNAEEKTKIQTQIQEAQKFWHALQQDIRSLYRDMSDGEEEVRKLEDEIESIRQSQIAKARLIQQSASQEKVNQNDTHQLGNLSSVMTSGQLDTTEISNIKSKIQKLENLVLSARSDYKKKIALMNEGLILDEASVLKTFSALSGIPVDRLNEDEKVKLRQLDSDLAVRVVGQQEPTTEVAKSVKRSRLGLKMPNKPSGTFMFLGPSGVGKTELAKALAESLQVPLLRFDMSEYMEKHAIAKLIGAPPGYEGYEHGGILTNAARRNPYSVVLFDEIEKAHLDVFNLMLQLLDDARLTDSRGLTASFKDAIIIMTTNIGTSYFLDESITFAESKELAFEELRKQYRPEFLGRFGGNIYCFQRLSLDVLKIIAKKDLKRINSLVVDKGITLTMPEDALEQMINAKYVVREGARSILGFIDRNITSGLADVVLEGKTTGLDIVVKFDQALGKVIFE